MSAQKKTEKEKLDTVEKRYNRFNEETKTWNDYLKHLATLNTGLIIIIATFLDKFTDPELNQPIKFVVGFAAISLGFIVLAQASLALRISMSTDDINSVPKEILSKLPYIVPTVLAYACFLISLTFIVIFVVNKLSNN